MSVTAVWNAIIAGDVAALQKCIRSGTPNTNIGQRLDNHRWNILQHAVITRKLDCVKLVVDHFAPDPTVPCYEGLTPLARACEQSVPLEIVQYLLLLNKRIINTGNNEQITPLHYAVSKNRLDIVKLLVANGANPNAMDYANETPLDTAVYDTGNIAILIYLLFVAKAKWGSVPNRLIIFGGRATYPVKKKIACFKILFNHEYPKHAYRQRYYVNDVLAVALMSNGSSSLIPYFIETELKWEKRVDVRSLYSRLMNRFQLLALSVFSHCGPVASESRPKWCLFENRLYKLATLELKRLMLCALGNKRPKSYGHALTLLEDFVTFWSKLFYNVFDIIMVCTDIYFDGRFNLSTIIYNNHQKVVDCIVTMTGKGVDEIVSHILKEETKQGEQNPCMLMPYLKHCSPVLMRKLALEYRYMSPIGASLLWLLDHFGTWQTISLIQKPKFDRFTLKRFARDVIRETVWENVSRPNLSHVDGALYFDKQLLLLDLPRELLLYLRLCDEDSFRWAASFI